MKFEPFEKNGRRFSGPYKAERAFVFAQALPWVIPSNRIGPEWGTRYGENRPRTFQPDRVRISSPFKAEPSGRITDAKYIQSLD